MENAFDKVGKALTSLSAVIIILLFTISGLVLFSQDLFSHVFPDSMVGWKKQAATWFLALAWEAGLLLTTVNAVHVKKNVPAIMAICSGIVVLFFLRAFDVNEDLLTLAQRWFLGILVALVNWIYTEIFDSKYRQRLQLVEAPAKLNEAQTRIDQLQRQLNEAHAGLNELSELKKFKAQALKELTCKHCGTVQASYGSLRAHSGHCLLNPINKKKVETQNQTA